VDERVPRREYWQAQVVPWLLLRFMDLILLFVVCGGGLWNENKLVGFGMKNVT